MVQTNTTEEIQTYPPALMQKLNRIMAKCGYLQKSGVNKEQKYKYAQEIDVLSLVRPLLEEEGVFVTQHTEHVERYTYETTSFRQGQTVNRTVNETRVDMVFTIVDVETGDSLPPMRFSGTSSTPGDKQTYIATTTTAKYFWLKTFLIPTGDDAEADEHHDPGYQVPDTRAAQPAPQSAPQPEPAQPPQPTAEAALPETITPEQERRLRELVINLHHEPELVRSYLKQTFGAERLADLTPAQASKFQYDIQEPEFGTKPFGSDTPGQSNGAYPGRPEHGGEEQSFNEHMELCESVADFVSLYERTRNVYGKDHAFTRRAQAAVEQASERQRSAQAANI